jgi:hypothetical protein
MSLLNWVGHILLRLPFKPTLLDSYRPPAQECQNAFLGLRQCRKDCMLISHFVFYALTEREHADASPHAQER